jgi:glycosyltransferase involved in cell wall biosynthesis
LQTLYEKASLYVFPSEYEGFGLPPLEAMSRGCAVVSSTATCLPEVLGDAACYFDPRSEDSMSQAIESVLSNQTYKEQLITKGRERIKLYSWVKAGQETLKVYQQALTKEAIIPSDV